MFTSILAKLVGPGADSLSVLCLARRQLCPFSFHLIPVGVVDMVDSGRELLMKAWHFSVLWLFHFLSIWSIQLLLCSTQFADIIHGHIFLSNLTLSSLLTISLRPYLVLQSSVSTLKLLSQSLCICTCSIVFPGRPGECR